MQNKPLIQQVVVVAVPALAFQEQRTQQENMPFTMATLGNPVQCRMDDGKSSFQSSLERLLTLPATKSQKQQLKKQPRSPPKPPSDFALSLDKMRQLEYPMPVRIPQSCLVAAMRPVLERLSIPPVVYTKHVNLAIVCSMNLKAFNCPRAGGRRSSRLHDVQWRFFFVKCAVVHRSWHLTGVCIHQLGTLGLRWRVLQMLAVLQCCEAKSLSRRQNAAMHMLVFLLERQQQKLRGWLLLIMQLVSKVSIMSCSCYYKLFVLLCCAWQQLCGGLMAFVTLCLHCARHLGIKRSRNIRKI